MSHPFKNHSVFSTRTCLCSWPSVSDYSHWGAFQAFIYQGNNGWGPLALWHPQQHARGPSCLLAVTCLYSGLHPGWHCTWLLIPIRSQGVKGIWARAGGRKKKGHPGAVSLSAGLPVCVPVYGAAERAPGEAGAAFFRRLSPCRALAWHSRGRQGTAPALWVTDGGRPHAVQQMLLRPKREHEDSSFVTHAQDTANCCKVLISPWSRVQPF